MTVLRGERVDTVQMQRLYTWGLHGTRMNDMARRRTVECFGGLDRFRPQLHAIAGPETPMGMASCHMVSRWPLGAVQYVSQT